MENSSGNRAIINGSPRTNTDNSRINFFLDGPGDVLTIQGDERVSINRSQASFPLHLGDNTTNGNGAHLTNGGIWTNGSSRDFKNDIRLVDYQSILSKLVAWISHFGNIKILMKVIILALLPRTFTIALVWEIIRNIFPQ